MKSKKKIKKKTIFYEMTKFPGITYHSTEPRRFRKIVIDYYNKPELFGKDLEEIIGDIKDCIVQIDIKVSSEDNHKVNLEKIKNITSEAFFVKEVSPSIVKERSYRRTNINAEMNVLDATRTFIDEKKPKSHNIILKLAESLIEEVKIR